MLINMPGFERYVTNMARWKNAFKPKNVKKNESKVQVGEGSGVKMISPSQQIVDQARSEVASPLHRDLQGVLHNSKVADKKPKVKRRSTSKQVRSVKRKSTTKSGGSKQKKVKSK